MDVQHMAVDQFGTTYHGLGRHPRKALMERLGRRSAQRMYCDDRDGTTYHVGWVVAGHWCSVYRVEPMRVTAIRAPQ